MRHQYIVLSGLCFLLLVFVLDFVNCQKSTNNLAEMLMIKQEDRLNTIAVHVQRMAGESKVSNIAMTSSLAAILTTLKSSASTTQTLLRYIASVLEHKDPQNMDIATGGVHDIASMLPSDSEIETVLSKIDQSNSQVAERFDKIHVNNQKIVTLLDQLIQKNIEIQANMSDVWSGLLQIMKKQVKDCKHPWIELDNECFFISQTKKYWHDAKKECESMGPGIYLAEPSNVYFIAQYNDQTWKNSNREERAWVGATGKKSDGWEWNSGRVIARDAKYWSSGNPNDDTSQTACAYLLKGEIADWSCNTNYHYVCQRP